MSPQEKATELILLKERFTLISEGVSRKSIKIVGSALLINNVKHGSVINSKYSRTNNQIPPQQSSPSITVLSSTDANEDNAQPTGNTETTESDTDSQS